MRLKFQILLITILLSRLLPAQTPEQVNAYINTYKFLAVAEMQRTGVPASIILAQGIHETSAGTSDLVIASNNHFGIKCKAGWTGQTVYHDDDARGECFRSYDAAADSYRDHSDYLSQTPRYAFLFKLDPEDYEGWAYGLKKAGYATNIKYSQILIKLVEDYDLEKYSLIAMGKLPAEQPAEGTLAKEMMRESLQGFLDSSLQKAAPAASYPDGAFSINAAKCIYAKAGVSLLSLSNQYEIPLAHLLEFNDMNQEDVLNNDQLIFLQRKRKIGYTSFHTVQQGESMYTICQEEGIRYENILEFNRLKPGEEPAQGEKIYLQTMAGTKPAIRNAASVKTDIPSS
jgi:Mannosyl-glycoprotein endo-beta-N-acetylglucosaminidase/LysM domain